MSLRLCSVGIVATSCGLSFFMFCWGKTVSSWFCSSSLDPGWNGQKSIWHVWLSRVIVAGGEIIPRSYCVWTEIGWKSVLLRNFNSINPYWLQLKQLIRIEHELNVRSCLISSICLISNMVQSGSVQTTIMINL